ncbi:MAG: exodeoxyribonuclease VII large subunit [Candidatus Riflebacteria bacterium]|nr:exodeoxyribonuclease VII large subunit [Candidatus Riflebacteria bacterium]
MKRPFAAAEAAGKILSVGELTSHIKTLLEDDEVLSGVWVQGEISNLVKAASGHAYFTLKDDKAVVKAALWAGVRRQVKTEFKNGDKVAVCGSVSVYEPRGEYQIIVSDLRPAGIGALYEAFEKLKQKLAAEGLFDPARKLPLPFLPRGVGIVTSPKGAVVQDIFRVVRRRFPNMPLYLVPAKVQGEGAVSEVVAGIRLLDADPRVDVIIVARGGGSLEDLWTFNEEAVCRAIAAAVKPVVSAVGHETDTTIADFVADRRAATPSVAGELVVPVKDDLVRRIQDRTGRLHRAVETALALARQRLRKAQACRFLQKPAQLIAERRLKVLNLARDVELLAARRFEARRHGFQVLAARLTALNPRSLLRRGFIMATDESGAVVSSVRGLRAGQPLHLAFADGRAGARVEEPIECQEEPS